MARPAAAQHGASETTDVSPQGATFDSQRDCATSDDERCKQKVHGEVNKGVGAGYATERVVHLTDPSDHFLVMAIDGGFMYGTATGGALSSNGASTSIYGGGANFNLQYRLGGQFPGQEGGAWSGLGIDVSAGIFGSGVVTSFGNNSTGAGLLLENGGLTAGYQFFNFGEMDPGDFKQHGFGFFAGGRVGVANANIFANSNSSSTNAQYGPNIQLTFPEYNFGTTQRAAFYISAYLLPTGDFLLMNIQFGGAFSL